MIRTKRVYDPPARGVRKDAIDRWEKELAPSIELLWAYRAGAMAWSEFARCYRAELRGKGELIEALSKRARRRTVTLVCGCEDESRCHRTVLKEIVGRL